MQHVLPGNLAREGFNLTTYLPKNKHQQNDQGKGSFTVLLLKGCFNDVEKKLVIFCQTRPPGHGTDHLIGDASDSRWCFQHGKTFPKKKKNIQWQARWKAHRPSIHARHFHPPTRLPLRKWPRFSSLGPYHPYDTDFKDPSFGASWGSPGNAKRRVNVHQQKEGPWWKLFIMWFLNSSPPPPKKRKVHFSPKDLWFKKTSKNRNIFPPHPSSVSIFGNLLPRSQSRHHVYLGSRRLGKSPQKRTEKSSVASKKLCHHWTFCLNMLSFTKLDHVGPFCWNRFHSDW